jgi:hypothetical protein
VFAATTASTAIARRGEPAADRRKIDARSPNRLGGWCYAPGQCLAQRPRPGLPADGEHTSPFSARAGSDTRLRDAFTGVAVASAPCVCSVARYGAARCTSATSFDSG